MKYNIGLKMNNAMDHGSQEISNDFSDHPTAMIYDVAQVVSEKLGSDEQSRGLVEQLTISPDTTEHETLQDQSSSASATSDSLQYPQAASQDLEAATTPPEPPYSIFTRSEKRLALTMAALSAIISPLSSSIYLPALNTLSHHYNVSNSLINLTVTSYLVFRKQNLLELNSLVGLTYELRIETCF